MIFPGTEVRLTVCYFPGLSFLPFLKMDVALPFFQSPGASPHHYVFSDNTESALLRAVMTSCSLLQYENLDSSA